MQEYSELPDSLRRPIFDERLPRIAQRRQQFSNSLATVGLWFLVWLQRHHPITARLTLVPKKEQAAAAVERASVI